MLQLLQRHLLSDIIIAAGAAEMFLCPKICKANATPPDKIPAYKISTISNLILEKLISSNNITSAQRIKQLLLNFAIKQ